MAIYDGVVTIAEDDIPVIVELDDDFVRLSASGTEIGQWPTEECSIARVGNSTYTITAEDETLHFVPNQPGLFDTALDGGDDQALVAMPPPDPDTKTEYHGREAPPPKPLTMGLFYALCVLTAGLAVWSLISMIL